MRWAGPIAALFVVLATGVGSAQIRGVPPSITSLGNPNHPNVGGTPASVTSQTPGSRRQIRVLLAPDARFPHPRHQRDGFPVFIPFYVPFYSYYGLGYGYGYDDGSSVMHADEPMIIDGRDALRAREAELGYPQTTSASSQQQLQQELQQYRDLLSQERDRLASAKAQSPSAQVEDRSVNGADQAPDEGPVTVLVFRDGHQVEIHNYAMVGETIYVFEQHRMRRVALSDLDLDATREQNQELGNDFKLPAVAPAPTPARPPRASATAAP